MNLQNKSKKTFIKIHYRPTRILNRKQNSVGESKLSIAGCVRVL